MGVQPPSRFSNFLIIIDKIADGVPILSTLTNLVDLALKAVFSGRSSKTSLHSRYIQHIQNKDAKDCGLLLLPILGNILVPLLKDPLKEGDYYEKMGEGAKAFRCYKHASLKGNLQAQWKLGLCYEHGIGCEQDSNTALVLLEGAAHQGNRDAQYELGRWYETGTKSVTKNIDKALDWYEAAMRKGSTEAKEAVIPITGIEDLLHCGPSKLLFQTCFKDRYNAHPSPTETPRAKVTSVKQQSPEVVSTLAAPLAPTTLTPTQAKPNESREETCLRAVIASHEDMFSALSSSTSYPERLRQLGELLEEGKIGGKKEPEAAFFLYMQAERLFDNQIDKAHAWSDLALCYENSIGCEQNKKKAFELYQKAAPHYAPAQYNLGRCYEVGIGTERDDDKAFEEYNKAAQRKQPDAMCRMAVYQEKGFKNIQPDPKKAFELYKESADALCLTAKWMLGRCYELGIGVPVDKKQALQHYQEAADAGYGTAQFEVARCLQYGIGTEKNMEQAIRLYDEAAEKDCAEAQYARAMIYLEKETYSLEEGKKAFDLLGKAARQGNSNAQYILGQWYETGSELVPQNLDTALEWYEASLENGSTEAEEAINRLKENRESPSL